MDDQRAGLPMQGGQGQQHPAPTAHSRETPLTACVSSRLLAPMSITRGAGGKMAVESVALEVDLKGEIQVLRLSAPTPQHSTQHAFRQPRPSSPGRHHFGLQSSFFSNIPPPTPSQLFR